MDHFTECQARAEYDAARGVSLEKFLVYRVLAGVLTRYRQEWSYSRHIASEGVGRTMTAAENGRQNHPTEVIQRAVAGLGAADRWMLGQIFWFGRTETEVARTLGISQPAAHRRKCTALSRLGDRLNKRP